MALFYKSMFGNKRKRLGLLAECLTGIGLWVAILTVTFGIVASGILMK